MSDNPEQMPAEETSASERIESDIEKRLWWLMIASLLVSLIFAFIFTNIQFILGFAIGGMLSLINFKWLQGSIKSLFAAALNDEPPGFIAFRFFLRFIVIGITLGIASYTDSVSVIGILLGLCSFVVAIMIEAFHQIYVHFSEDEEI
jgi:FtsH-binding integral membrane protein